MWQLSTKSIIEPLQHWINSLLNSSQVWSIVYHSWLTFIFLLFANLLWIIPNQRANMHRFSPLVVTYAIFLLLSQYLYCMNLTEEELPAVSRWRPFNLPTYDLTLLFLYCFFLTGTFDANRFCALQNISMFAIALENRVHADILADLAPNEIWSHIE